MRAAFESDSPLKKYKKKMEKSNLNETVEDPDNLNKSSHDAESAEVLKILKKMSEKGRSAHFKDILKLVLEKYNNLIVWPFIRKSEDK